MRAADLRQVAAGVGPLVSDFARQARVRVALLITPSGQVLAREGSTRTFDVGGTATLGAGIYASSRALARLLGSDGFRQMSGMGRESELFVGVVRAGQQELILLAVFGDESSLGLVRVYFRTFRNRVARVDALAAARPTADARRFDDDLEAGLSRVPS